MFRRKRWIVILEGIYSGRRTELSFARFRTRRQAEDFAAYLNDPVGNVAHDHVRASISYR